MIRAQHVAPTLFLLPKPDVEAAERTELFWFVGAPRQQEAALAALSKVGPAAMAEPTDFLRRPRHDRDRAARGQHGLAR